MREHLFGYARGSLGYAMETWLLRHPYISFHGMSHHTDYDGFTAGDEDGGRHGETKAQRRTVAGAGDVQ